jgi:NAD/NADP transhydrogenase beta subunit
MKDLLRLALSGYQEIGGAQGIGIALIVTFWMDRWSRIPFGTLIAACLYGLVSAYVLAARHHIYKLPNYAHANVWIGFVALYICYFALMSLLFWLKSTVFGPWAR